MISTSGLITVLIAGGVSMGCGNGTQICIPHKTWFTWSAKVTGEQTGSLHILTGMPTPSACQKCSFCVPCPAVPS